MKSLWYVKYTVFLLLVSSIFLFVHSSFYIDKITVQGADKLGAKRLSGFPGCKPE